MPQQDPLGAALTAYLGGDKKASISVQSTITIGEAMDASYLFRSYKQMPSWEKLALKACRGKVLDVGAGAGVHSKHLQEKGLAVTAIDTSATAVAVMQAEGVIDARVADLMAWQEGPYDTILLLMNGIGLVGNLKGLQQFLARAYQMLSPNGQILLESTDILYMYEEKDGSFLLELTGDYYGEIQYQMSFQGMEGPWFDWLYIDFPLLAQYAEQAGFQAECLHMGAEHNYLARLRK